MIELLVLGGLVTAGLAVMAIVGFVLFLIKQQIPTIGSPDLLNFNRDTQAGIYLRGMVLAQQ